jgi:tetratricopeptide (TPR) repeat protein
VAKPRTLADSTSRLIALQANFCDFRYVKSLGAPDTFHLSAAIGWLELGDWHEANEELEKITPAFRAHADVLATRLAIYAKAKKWERCVDIGNALVKAIPNRSSGWLQRSFALHELKRTQDAADLLLPAAVLFPKEWLIRYNLACYACQLGKRKEAWEWLEFAFDLSDSKAVKLMALNDPDLETLWTEIAEI